MKKLDFLLAKHLYSEIKICPRIHFRAPPQGRQSCKPSSGLGEGKSGCGGAWGPKRGADIPTEFLHANFNLKYINETRQSDDVVPESLIFRYVFTNFSFARLDVSQFRDLARSQSDHAKCWNRPFVHSGSSRQSRFQPGWMSSAAVTMQGLRWRKRSH